MILYYYINNYILDFIIIYGPFNLTFWIFCFILIVIYNINKILFIYFYYMLNHIFITKKCKRKKNLINMENLHNILYKIKNISLISYKIIDSLDSVCYKKSN